jgi:hypothetical protein
VVCAWWNLGDQLLVKYNHLWIYNSKTRERQALKFPAWYLKLLIDHNKIPAQPQEKK